MLQLPLPLERTDRPSWSIHLLNPQMLRDGLWDVVAEKLEIVRQRCHATWIVEDIYAQIVAHQAFVFAFYRDADLHGFTVVRKDIDKYSGEIFCLSFASWFEEFDDKTAERVVAFYDGIAKDMGVNMIRFESPRLGWKGKKHGCKLATIFWERRLEQG